MARLAWNPLRRAEPDWSGADLPFVEAIRTRAQLPLHRALPGYAPTPLRALPRLAAELGLGEILVKDESGRFGIDAFKGLGASYALYRELDRRWRETAGEALPPERFLSPETRARVGEFTVCAATDGNHGRAVAWTARLIGQRAVIFMPADTAAARVAQVEAEGATVRLVPGSFDDCVTACAETAASEGWQVIADTAYPGNMTIPGHIMTGYSTIFVELEAQLPDAPDLVLLPAGVGGLAAAGCASLVLRHGAARPRIALVEPESAGCFLASFAAGEARGADGDLSSRMVGLCCGVPSALAWPVIRDAADLGLAVADAAAFEAMRACQREGITAGESGAAALAGLLALMTRADCESARSELGLGGGSRVLVINTEGATDPDFHAEVVAGAEEERA